MDNAGLMVAKMRLLNASFAALVVSALPAQAGMTVYGLTDFAKLRLEEISFFIVLFIVCAVGVKLLWNTAVKGFDSLPRIGFKQSFALTLLFGMAMLLLLTMISGIREVLTPGAWRKQGTAYRLNDPAQEPVRLKSLGHLRAALFDYARTRDGKFPPHDFVPEISEKLWEAPDQNATRYRYHGGWTTNDLSAVIAEEPAVFGNERFVLLGSGAIEKQDRMKPPASGGTNP
ncbi:MAG: hypothetical protein HC841_00860 [Verrucomicrobiae bacterium]|nr:hypothetical protein [Verrucomicrobiae bacterium]